MAFWRAVVVTHQAVSNVPRAGTIFQRICLNINMTVEDGSAQQRKGTLLLLQKPCVKAFDVVLFQFDEEDGGLLTPIISTWKVMTRCRCVALWNRQDS